GNSTPEDLFERLNQQTSEGESLNNYLNTNEYDLVWVDYVDAFAAIEENADNLIEVIDWVNSRKYADGSNEPNNIIAFSMGGLVAKLALLKMYNVQNRDPEVERFFSWDSPLQGANYPLGIQAFLRDVIYNAANFGASTASLQEAIFLLDSGAAVDLLKARVEIDCPTNSTCPLELIVLPPSNLFDEIEQLESIAPLNQRTRHIAMVNGADNGVLQNNISSVMKILEFNLQLDEVDGVGAWQWCYDVIYDADAYAATAQSTLIYERTITVDISLGCEPFANDDTEEVKLILDQPMALDNVPGGISDIGFSALQSGIQTMLDGLSHVEEEEFNILINSFSFIPTISSIYMPAGTDPAIANPTAGPEIDRWSAPVANQEHVSMNLRIADIIVSEFDASSIGQLTGTLFTGQTYNFGRTVPIDNESVVVETQKVIDQDLTINNGGQLWINRDGPIAYNIPSNPANNSQQSFTVTVPGASCVDDGSSVTVTAASGGQLIIGDYASGVDNIGRLYFGKNGNLIVNGDEGVLIERFSTLSFAGGATMTINSGGTVEGARKSMLFVNDKSEVRIEDGGMLLLEQEATGYIGDGAKVHVTPGGTLRLSEGGQLIVQAGGILEIDAGADLDLYWHASNILVEKGGELIINGTFEFDGYGYFQFDRDHIFTQNAPLVLDGQNDRFLRLNENARLRINHHGLNFRNGEVEYREGAVIEVAPGAEVDAWNMKFESIANDAYYNIGFQISEASKIEMWFVEFESLSTGLLVNHNFTDLDFEIRHSEFSNCRAGLEAGYMEYLRLVDVDFWARENGVQALFTDQISTLSISGGVISNYDNGSASAIQVQNTENMNLFGTHVVENRRGILLEDVFALRVFAGLIGRNSIVGIDVPIKQDGTGNESNIFLFSQAQVNQNEIGIHVEQGKISNSTNEYYGMVTLDCAEMRDNTKGIKGEDVLLNIDAYVNAGTTDASMIRPNRIYGSGRYFEICYSAESEVDEVLAKGNYWGGGLPSFWQYQLNNPTTQCGTFGGILNASDPEDTLPIGCNDEDGPIEPQDDTVGGPIINFPEDSLRGGGPSCIFTSNDGPIELHTIHEDAYNLFRAGMHSEATDQFAITAGVSTFTTSTSTAVCKQYINVGRVMARGQTVQLQVIQENPFSPNITPSEIALVYPNPAGNMVNLEFKEEIATVNIMDLMGRKVYSRQNLNDMISIDISTWEEGAYLVEIRSKNTNSIYHKRLVVVR
ncbi:MAG: T9SS type A sorting domain-containing protein, partial [Bacteroidota bacterium]